MSTSRDGIRIKTVKELFDSDLKLLVETKFYSFYNNSEHSALLRRISIGTGPPDWAKSASDNYVIVSRCDRMKVELNVESGSNVNEHYYLLPEILIQIYEEFMLAARSPFYEKLQTYHNYVFESGIRQPWTDRLKVKETSNYEREELYIKNEEYLLTMDDLYGIFYIVLVGYAASFVVFLYEVFWHDFLRYFNIKQKISKVAKKMTQRKRKM